jgi:crotonobetainyl-CoA:carnitine CoA-transferase CaiB-like acyl-CoA transferase
MTSAPLHGVRVLDLSTVVAGPYGSEMLGELGADVIRIEPVSAAASPAPAAGAPISEPEGFLWALQKNKRAICMDLKHPEGLALFLDLVKTSDVVWDNFRPGVTERLGIDYPKLRAVHPGIVACSISGLAPRAVEPRRARLTVQALSGVMSITGTGEPDSEPCRWGVPIGDIAGAIYGVIGVLAALEERAHRPGQQVDVRCWICITPSTWVPQVFGSNMNSHRPRRAARAGCTAVPVRRRRWLSIAPSTNFWSAFCGVIGRLTSPPMHAFARFTASKPACAGCALESVMRGNQLRNGRRCSSPRRFPWAAC